MNQHLAASTFAKAKIVSLPGKVLSVVWASAQRTLDDAHAKSIAADFDPDKFGVIIVTLPDGNGIYHVVDGQHRALAVRILWGEDEMVPCIVVNATDPARAAEIFNAMNTKRKPPSPIDIFNVRVTAKHETEVAVARIVRESGYKISMSGRDGTIGAVQSLVWVYNRFGETVLRDTLKIIQGTWGLEANAVTAQLIRGFASFMAEYGHKANWGRVTEKVQRTFTPGKLTGAGKTMREMLRGSSADAIKQVIINTYNSNLKSGHLT